MHRRRLIVAVAGLAGLSGCSGIVPLGGTSAEESGGVGGDESWGGGTDRTATPTRATPTRTPSEAERLREVDVERLLGLARERTDRAVDAYAGADEPLTAVTAASASFDPSRVVEHLYRARAAYDAADRQGITSDQRATVQRLDRVGELLRVVVDVQTLLVDSYADVERLVDAVAYGDAETVESVYARATTRHRRAAETVPDLSRSRYTLAIGVSERPSRAEYGDKRRQLEGESEALGLLLEAAGGVAEGVRLLSRARGKRESGAPYTAVELARDAEAAFERAVRELDRAVGTLPREGRSFSDVAADLLRATEAGRREARSLHRDVL